MLVLFNLQGAYYNTRAFIATAAGPRTVIHPDSCTILYISLVIIVYRKYTGVHDNDFTAHG